MPFLSDACNPNARPDLSCSDCSGFGILYIDVPCTCDCHKTPDFGNYCPNCETTKFNCTCEEGPTTDENETPAPYNPSFWSTKPTANAQARCGCDHPDASRIHCGSRRDGCNKCEWHCKCYEDTQPSKDLCKKCDQPLENKECTEYTGYHGSKNLICCTASPNYEPHKICWKGCGKHYNEPSRHPSNLCPDCRAERLCPSCEEDQPECDCGDELCSNCCGCEEECNHQNEWIANTVGEPWSDSDGELFIELEAQCATCGLTDTFELSGYPPSI